MLYLTYITWPRAPVPFYRRAPRARPATDIIAPALSLSVEAPFCAGSLVEEEVGAVLVAEAVVDVVVMNALQTVEWWSSKDKKNTSMVSKTGAT